ncbi:MAG: ABC transporter ATP-binding protein [Scytonema sp. RU_4_4]|nr:ABC transporter ATP-binding protein [Scytonema sp. RU_4_4]
MGQRSKEKDLKGVIPGVLRILRNFSPYIRKQRVLIAGSFLALLLETGLRLLEPWPLKYVFDYILIPAHSNSASVATIFGLNQMVLLALSALAIVSITGIGSMAAYLSTYGMSLAVVQVLSEVRGHVFHHLQHLSLSFHQEFKSGDLITRVTADIEKMRLVTIKTALPLFTNTISLVGMSAIMFWLNWELALVAIAIFPLLTLLTSKMISRIRSFAKQHRDSEGVLAATTGETIGAIKVVQVLSLQEMLHGIFAAQNQKSLDEAIESLKLSAALERTVQVLMAIIIAAVLWRGSHVVLHKGLTPGELLVFITYLKNAFEPMRKLSNQVGQIAKATASGERVVELLEYEPNVRDLPGAQKAHPFFGAVRFENVSFGYNTGGEILKDISFVARPGQLLAVVGPSGSGKSTLLSLILRLYDPQSGRIFIDGQDIREYTIDSLRQQISVVLQDSVLFAVSVRENIAYGKLGSSDKEVENAARLANAHEFIMKLPQGYDTILGERGGTLSGGQRQRVAIARAAIRQAPIVILDESTTGLDNASERNVNAALEKLTEERTTFVISHNLKTVQNADLILYVEGGSILEQGTHSELMRLGGHYATLYRLQSIVDDTSPQGDSYAIKA